MSLRLPKPKLTPILISIVALSGLAGAAALTRAPHQSATIAGIIRPSVNPAPSASATPAPAEARVSATSQPAVAGAATQAQVPAAKAVAAAAATPAIPAPTPAPSIVNLTLIAPTGTTNFTVKLIPGADACTVLKQAKSEGKISFLDIDDSYLNTSLKSAYVRQINSFANNWTVKVNGVAPRGCSLVHPQHQDNVTWRYQ